ncbi:MAG TPA: Spy/CpxP family protein refolding chaperone [Burkholderiaceae bacterium]|nr:Spy/CpxP family protein refolding chaperone [Burkholderiaceae bacterium]
MRVKNVLIGAAAASALVAGLVMAQPYGGMGPGMMGGYGGPGMGPGMMGGYGGPGMGMMWGYGSDAYAGLNLSAEQRKKIADIQEETRKAMWQLMGTMHQQDYHMYGMFGPGPLDEQAANKAYEAMAATQKAMFQMRLEARKKIDAVLTNEQREQLRRYWGSR